MKIKDSPKCSYCDEQSDTIQHFLLHCEKVRSFWTHLFNWLTTVLQIDIDVLEEEVIFGFLGGDPMAIILNFVTILAKTFIYQHKINGNNNIDVYKFKVLLNSRLKIEKSICEKNNKMHKFRHLNILYSTI